MHARRPAYRIFAEHFITATVGLKISMNEFTQNVKEVKKKMCECSLENVLHWKSSVFEKLVQLYDVRQGHTFLSRVLGTFHEVSCFFKYVQ